MVVDGLEIPDRRGGWWHEYVCPTHGTELRAARDGGFPCPHGCWLTGEPYAGAWAVLAHQRAARSLRRLAVLGSTDAAVDGLCRYAELYQRLATDIRADAQPWMLAGKLFQQALTEAIWGTSIALAVQNLTGPNQTGPFAVTPPVVELLRALRSGARDARAVLVAKDDFANNYTAWLNAAGATISRALALLGEPDETETWITGARGLVEHLAVAVHPDGWEWEGSTYYHVFVLRAYLLSLRGRSLSEDLRDRLLRMVDVVAALATDRGGMLPALNDTPYGDPGWDEEIHELCLLAAGLPGAPDLRFLAEPLAARLPATVVEWRRSEAGGWWSGAPATPSRDRFALHTYTQHPVQPQQASRTQHPVQPQRASRLFPDAGYAVLAGDGYRAVLDLGPHGGSHGHLDKLALYLYGSSARWQPAYGVPPYGHPWRRGYYRATAAHPTLTVDGTDQAEADGRLLYWRSGDGWAEVGAAADVYAGVSFERHVRAEARCLVDVVRVTADEPRDFTLHLRADVDVTVRHTLAGAQTDWPGDGGLTGLHTALTGAAGAPPRLSSATDAHPRLTSATDTPPQLTGTGAHPTPAGGPGGGPVVLSVGPDLGPADDPQRTRPHLRWSARVRDVVFASVYTPAGSPVVGLDVEASGPELVIRLHSGEGAPFIRTISLTPE